MYKQTVPSRVRVLVLGGGIHGVGVLHDLVARGWTDVHLVEKSHLAAGTSSKSTKLIHGGLRYLRHLSQYRLVSESLRERDFLLRIAPDIVHPLELLFPVARNSQPSSIVIKTGLVVYDMLSGKRGIKKHSLLSDLELRVKAEILKLDEIQRVYSFWDAQTDDMALVQRVADSAVMMGASITEACTVVGVKPDSNGWSVQVKTESGSEIISAMYVVNCLGPWSNAFLRNTGINPIFEGINNKGSHLLFADIGLRAGLFLPSIEKNRITFVLPWQGMTLVGTTEDSYDGNLDRVEVQEKEVDYLLFNCNRYLSRPLSKREVKGTFAGLRWLAAGGAGDLSALSREYVLSEHTSARGLLLTIYGGKLTSYRALAEKIGDRITSHFGEHRPCRTLEPTSWVQKSTSEVASIRERFNAV